MAKKQKKDSRLSLRIPAEQKTQMLDYSERHEVSLSELVTRFFDNLLAHERRNKPGTKVPEKFF
jgi:hypothetical protein